MTREEAIKTLGKDLACYKASDDCGLNCSECNLLADSKDLMEAYEMAIIALGGQKIGKWIPVSDPLNELPKDRHLLVTVEEYVWHDEKCRYVTELYYDMTEWSDINDARNAIAYMSYPEPYEAESEDQNG